MKTYRKYHYTVLTIAQLTNRTVEQVKKDKYRGKLNPSDLESVLWYLLYHKIPTLQTHFIESPVPKTP